MDLTRPSRLNTTMPNSRAPSSARNIGDFGHNPYSAAHRANRAAFALLWQPLELELEQRNWGVGPGAIVERYAAPLRPRRIARLWLSPTRGTFRIRIDGQSATRLHEMRDRLNGAPDVAFGKLTFGEITVSRANGNELCIESVVPIERFFSRCRGTNAMTKRIVDVVLSVIDTADQDQNPTGVDDLGDVDLIGAREGTERLVTHLRRERSPKLRKAKIAAVMRTKSGRLACEVCDLDSAARYGEIGNGFAEVHHRKQLANSGTRRTALADLAILCSNCHRIIHRTVPMWTVERLRRHVSAQR